MFECLYEYSCINEGFNLKIIQTILPCKTFLYIVTT